VAWRFSAQGLGAEGWVAAELRSLIACQLALEAIIMTSPVRLRPKNDPDSLISGAIIPQVCIPTKRIELIRRESNG